QVLMLDEPTNFLDIHTIEALDSMLQAYPATILLVSHDKMFRENIADIEYEIKDGRMISDQTASPINDTEEELMIIDNKIAEVLGKLSVEPTEALDKEFTRLIQVKRVLNSKDDERRQ